MTTSTIPYFTETGELAYMPDRHVEMIEIPFDDWQPSADPDERIYSEYVPLADASRPGDTEPCLRDSLIESAKGQLRDRLAMRAKYEEVSRATYAFDVRPDHRGIEAVFAVGRLA